MTKQKPRNLAASVRQRLMNVARTQKEDFRLILTRYALERLLYRLSQAIRATFERRRTPVPAEVPLALSAEFSSDQGKHAQWRAFIGKGKLDTGGAGLNEVVDAPRGFLMRPAKAAATGGMLEMVWPAFGPWRSLSITKVFSRSQQRPTGVRRGESAVQENSECWTFVGRTPVAFPAQKKRTRGSSSQVLSL